VPLVGAIIKHLTNGHIMWNHTPRFAHGSVTPLLLVIHGKANLMVSRELCSIH
jgi:hypothetical protein